MENPTAVCASISALMGEKNQVRRKKKREIPPLNDASMSHARGLPQWSIRLIHYYYQYYYKVLIFLYQEEVHDKET
jgi:hypothetical protein